MHAPHSSVGLRLFGLLVLCGMSSCAQPVSTPTAPALPTQPERAAPSPTTPSTSRVTTITRIPWVEPLSVSLVGVGAKAEEAVVLLRDRQKPYGFALDTYDLRTGQRTQRWEASPEHARALVKGYPRFRTLTGAFEADLARYAGFVRRAAGWAHQEETAPLNVTVSPDARHILYTVPPGRGKDGDWIHRASPEGKFMGRFAPMVRASYRLNFSPNSMHVAWMGGQPKFATSYQQVGYVLHVSSPEGNAPRTFPKVRGLLRTPLWTPDSRALFALGRVRRRDGIKQCLFYVDLTKPDSDAVEQVFCDAGTLNLSYAPAHERLLVLRPAQPGAAQQRVVIFDTKTRRQLAQHLVPAPRGLGRFAHVISKERIALHHQDGRHVHVVDAATGALERSIEVAPDGSYDGRHTTQVVDGAMVVVRRDAQGASLVRVKLD